MQTIQLLGGTAGARLPRAAPARTSRRAGSWRWRIAEALEAFDGEHACCRRPTWASATAGATSPSRRRSAIGRRGRAIERMRQTSRPTASARAQADVIVLAPLTADGLVAEGAAAGLAPSRRREIEPTDDHVGSEVVILRG